MKNTRVHAVSPKEAGMASNLTGQATIPLSNGSTLIADLYIPAMGTTPNTAFMDRLILASDGRTQVEPRTLRVERSERCIYAVGDAATYARPTAHSMFDAIPVMCSNIKRELLVAAGREQEADKENRTFKEDTRETHFVPIVAQRGVGVFMGWRLPSWVVSWVKGTDYLLWATSGTVEWQAVGERVKQPAPNCRLPDGSGRTEVCASVYCLKRNARTSTQLLHYLIAFCRKRSYCD